MTPSPPAPSRRKRVNSGPSSRPLARSLTLSLSLSSREHARRRRARSLHGQDRKCIVISLQNDVYVHNDSRLWVALLRTILLRIYGRSKRNNHARDRVARVARSWARGARTPTILLNMCRGRVKCRVQCGS